jgi:hypothetical protein
MPEMSLTYNARTLDLCLLSMADIHYWIKLDLINLREEEEHDEAD